MSENEWISAKKSEFPDSETGEKYQIVLKSGRTFSGCFMDYGFEVSDEQLVIDLNNTEVVKFRPLNEIASDHFIKEPELENLHMHLKKYVDEIQTGYDPDKKKLIKSVINTFYGENAYKILTQQKVKF